MSGVLLQALSHPHKPTHERASTQAKLNTEKNKKVIRKI